MRFPTIIAVCGGKRCGKDTIANYISESYGYTHLKISSRLKDMMKLLFHFTDDQVENDSKEQIDARWGISPRQAMQFFGTDIMQYKVQKLVPHIGRSFWIQNIVTHMKHNNEHKYVISDLRFLHEYRRLKEEWGSSCLVIQVTREHVSPSIDIPNAYETTQHISEQEYMSIPADIYIKNNGDLTQLQKDVQNCISQYLNQTISHDVRL